MHKTNIVRLSITKHNGEVSLEGKYDDTRYRYGVGWVNEVS